LNKQVPSLALTA